MPLTYGIKYWGLMGKENESLAGKGFNVGKVRVPDFPSISYRRPLPAIFLKRHNYEFIQPRRI